MKLKYILAFISDCIVAVPLIIISFFSIFKKNNGKSVFIGTMPINCLVFFRDGLRKIGYNADFVVHKIPQHETHIDYDVPKRIMFLHFYLRDYIIFLQAVYRYDIFLIPFLDRILDRHLILRWVELPLMKLVGKKVILNSYGYDVATPVKTLSDKNYKHSILEGYKGSTQYSKTDEDYIQRNMQHCLKYANHIISALDQAEYIPKVDSLLHLRCLDLKSIEPVFASNDKIVILHATNHPELKGTKYLFDAVNELSGEGYDINLQFIMKAPQHEVIEAIKKCDIIADQFLIGAYGRFAIEGMAYGKPVLCYLRDELRRYNPHWVDCPIINVSPENIKVGIKRLFDLNERITVGRKSRDFVEKYHSVEYMVSRFDDIVGCVYGSM